MSTDIQWMVIRNCSSFLVKRNGQFLSREANNLKNVHSKRASGLVNVKTIGVEACSDGKGVVLVTRKQNAGRCPNIQYRRTELKKGARNTLNVIRNTISKNKYRKDLKNTALRRASAILSSQRKMTDKKNRHGKK